MSEVSASPTHHLATLIAPANLLTTLRLVFSPLLFVLVLEADATRGASWSAFVLGWLLGGTDFFDGIVARRYGTASKWGAFIDPLADKVVVLGTAYCLIVVERYRWVPVGLMAIRELGITLYRSVVARHGVSIPARRSAKYKTLVQGLALSLALFPPLEDVDWVVVSALWVAVAFTLVTGLQYVADARRKPQQRS